MGKRSIQQAIAMLRAMKELPCCASLECAESWLDAVAPIASRIHGYKQVTNAYLLGLAIKHAAILVTLDQHIQAIAAAEFQHHLLTLA